MHFLTHLTIAIMSLIAIVFSCVLFTNAIEFLGNKLKLGNNATGSILAVLGTGLPETIVPLIAIFSAYYSDMELNIAQNIAQGAILGSPFMLTTLVMFILSLVLIYKKQTKLNLNHEIVLRDYKYFILSYLIAILFSFNFLHQIKFIAPIILLFLYGIFVYRTIVKSRCTCTECECEKLYFDNKKLNLNVALFLQLAFSLLILIISSHFFVEKIEYFSSLLNISPIILSLIITPIATELPECINSIIWLKQGKDDLAMANIIGAIAFQAMVPFSIVILLTNWKFDELTFLNIVLVILCSLFFIFSIIIQRKISLYLLFSCGIFYLIYILKIINI